MASKSCITTGSVNPHRVAEMQIASLLNLRDIVQCSVLPVQKRKDSAIGREHDKRPDLVPSE